MKIRAVAVLLTSLLLANNSYAAADKYSFDKEHTSILFFINHLGFSEKIGRFGDYDGYFIFDQEKPANSKVEITLKPENIDTFSPALNKELQEKAWFNTKQYPEIKFKSTKVTVTGENKADIVGWLTFLGKEKSVTLQATFNKSGIHPVTKKQVAGFSATTTINRSEFGMSNYVPAVGENVKLLIEVEGVKE